MQIKTKKFTKIYQAFKEAGISQSETPTNILFVSNSSVLVGVSIECLEQLFQQYDPNCSFFVYPSSKSFSFIQFADLAGAVRAKKELDGTKPAIFPATNRPITVFFVDKLPQPICKNAQNLTPEGLHIHSGFIDERAEQELMNFVECNSAKSTRLQKRRVFHFGHKFNYAENNAQEVAQPIPPILEALINRIMEKTDELHKKPELRPNRVTVNIYEPGQGIPPHTDTHSAFEEPIYSLSLGSDVVMEFRDVAAAGRHMDVLLGARSLMEMRGQARYRFKHGILSRKHDINPETNRLLRRERRISITFRTVRRQPCQCPFPEFCDWDRGGSMRVPSSDRQGRNLEEEYVQKVYERIADHFDQTRHSSWTGVSKFLDSLPANTLLLDIGCGNGKYLLRRDGKIKFGCDLSANLLRIAHQKGCAVFRSDALLLPVRAGAFDAAISIAVIHHFSTRERRRQAVRELIRVLRPGGHGCITAWAFEQTAPDGQTESIYASRMRANKEAQQQEGQEVEAVQTKDDQGNEAVHDESSHQVRAVQTTEDGQEVEAIHGESSHQIQAVQAKDDQEVEEDQEESAPQLQAVQASKSMEKLRIHEGRHFAQQDLLVPWASTDAVAAKDFRYYHLFARGELAQLVKEFGDEAELLEEQYDEGNWLVIFRRK